MGLDMYLNEKIYLGYYAPSVLVKGYPAKAKELEPNKLKLEGQEFSGIQYLVKEKAYWRKAYAIMDWIETKINTETGIENCVSYNISSNDLKELKKLCETLKGFTCRSDVPKSWYACGW